MQRLALPVLERAHRDLRGSTLLPHIEGRKGPSRHEAREQFDETGEMFRFWCLCWPPALGDNPLHRALAVPAVRSPGLPFARLSCRDCATRPTTHAHPAKIGQNNAATVTALMAPLVGSRTLRASAASQAIP